MSCVSTTGTHLHTYVQYHREVPAATTCLAEANPSPAGDEPPTLALTLALTLNPNQVPDGHYLTSKTGTDAKVDVEP